MKRKRSARGNARPPKRARGALDESNVATNPGVEHPVLQRLYHRVFSLRHYLLARLPVASKTRRRNISQLGLSDLSHGATALRGGVDFELGQLLDSTLVGVPPKAIATAQDDARDGDILNFSQQLLGSTAGATFKPGYFQQGEVGCSLYSCMSRSNANASTHSLSLP
jgi:hypothetical protein